MSNHFFDNYQGLNFFAFKTKLVVNRILNYLFCMYIGLLLELRYIPCAVNIPSRRFSSTQNILSPCLLSDTDSYCDRLCSNNIDN